MRVSASSLLSLVFLACAGVHAQDASLEDVVKAFNEAAIPEDLAIEFKPRGFLDVTFPPESEAEGGPVTLHAGIQLPRDATKGPPTFSIRGLRGERGPFVIATVDPDAPTPQNPVLAQIRHFLAGNFVQESDGWGLRNTSAAVTEYRQPTPPAGSDAHRYIFLLFEQPEGFDKQEVVTPTTDIRHFNISVFADEVGLGRPLAGTFMRVAPDPPSSD